MGEYHYIINRTKREYFAGIDIMEVAYNPYEVAFGLKYGAIGNGLMGNILAFLVTNNQLVGKQRWAGDSIEIISDYGDEKDLYYFIENNKIKDLWKNIAADVVREWNVKMTPKLAVKDWDAERNVIPTTGGINGA